ncbi:hypothetical protein M2337_003028 [Sphingobium sp. B2D3A]|nr:hypothetical protein [Sphingobium sp. B2D3A]
MLEEVIGVADLVMMDGDALLRAQLVDQLLHGGGRDDLIVNTLHDDAGGGAGREEREVVHVGRRGHRDKAAHFWAAHQQLHGDPRAKRETGDPCRLRFLVEALDPVECGGGIGELADAIVEHALRATDTPEIEPQRRKTALHEGLVERLRDAIVHRAAALRVRVQDQRNRRTRAGRRAETAFETAFGTGKNDVGHGT